MDKREPEFKYISEFEIVGDERANALKGNAPRELEQTEFPFIQARRVKAYTSCELDPLKGFACRDEDKPVELAPGWGEPRQRHERNLVGLAFSGGGIRSATFGLGVLQGLAELEVLRVFDYLSTVSGGGFIGSWLASWIKREGDVANVEKQLKPERVEQAGAERGFKPSTITPGLVGKGEPEPIFHLREFSNYLSPRLSAFSADSWTLLAIYLRNLLANQLALLPLVVAVLLLTRIYVGFLGLHKWVLVGVSVVGLALAIWWTVRRFLFLKLVTACGIVSVIVSYLGAFAFRQQFEPHVIAAFGPPAVLSVIGMVACLWVVIRSRDADEQEREWLSRFGAWLLLISVCWIAIFGVSLYGALWFWRADRWIQSTLTVGWIASAVAGVKAANSSKTNGQSTFKILDAVAIAGPVVFLIGLGCGLSVFMDEAFGSLKSNPAANAAASEGADPSAAHAATVPTRTNPKDPQFASTEVTYKSTLSGDEKTPKHETAWTRRVVEMPDEAAKIASDYWERIEKSDVRLLLFYFSASVLLAVFFGWRADINEFSLNAMYANRLARCYLGASRRKSRQDVCGTPSHSSGPIRHPDTVTGLDADDDFPLDDLRIGPIPNPPRVPPKKRSHGYWGPFPLINTALNLVAGEQLAWQERRAESFVLSPLYCGANSVGYRDARLYSSSKLTRGKLRKLKPLTLGRCVAISGAAASPNMGYHSAPAPAALMTIFNVRLGWWLPNPKSDDVFTSAGPGSGLQWLLFELFGYTNTKRDFVNLSDGGHFENLGAYELVRRRCRFIVVADGGADPNFEFEDLAGLIRKCRSDFGIDIEIDVSQLRRKDGKHSDVHCAIGTIRYDQVEPTAPVGTLVYVKPSLTGDESADIQYYAGKHPDFPHQPTLDQFFNESQFESYRALGYHCASRVFGAAVERVRNDLVSPKLSQDWIDSQKDNPTVLLKTARARHGSEVENLFYHLRKEWLAVPSEFEAGFLQSVEGFEDLQKDLAADPRLAMIGRGLYPELKIQFSEPNQQPNDGENLTGGHPLEQAETGQNVVPDGDSSVELHTASRMLQVMENAFLGAQMNRYYAHPLNAGWMNVFQRWGNWPALRRYWPLLRNEYSRDFVRFCERKLALKSEFTATLVTIDQLINESPQRDMSWSQICQEFDGEWPGGRRSGGPLNLKDFYEQAWQEGTTSQKALYCLLVGSKGEPDPRKIEDGFIGGVLALRELRQEHCPGFSVGADDKCALCTTPSKTGYELLVWVRPAFRQQSIGTQLVEQLFEMLFTPDEDPKPLVGQLGNQKTVRLSVLYPKRGWSANSGDAMEKMMWLSFFSFYGFRKPSAECPHSDLYEVLTLDIDP
jgi:hypothetical protein